MGSRLETLHSLFPNITPFRKELLLLCKARMRAFLHAETPAEPSYTLVRSLRLWPLDKLISLLIVNFAIRHAKSEEVIIRFIRSDEFINKKAQNRL